MLYKIRKMSIKKMLTPRMLFIISCTMGFQIIKAQPRLEIGGGLEVVTYKQNTWVVPRALIVAPELLLKNKLGFYFGYEFFGTNNVDNFGLTYKISDRWSIYYGRAIVNKQTTKPEQFPFTGRQDFGFSYALKKLPLNVKVGGAFWLGPTFQVTGNILNFTPKDDDKDGVINKLDKCPGTNPKYLKSIDAFGCPLDSDKDGVFDIDDKCISEKGLVEFGGCPPVKIDTVKHDDTIQLKPIDTTKEKILELQDTFPDKSIIAKKSELKFYVNEFKLSNQNQQSLQLLANYLKENETVKVRIEGHTDESGSEDYNLDLSFQRAYSVRDYLITIGVKSHQLEVIGFGEKMPKVKNDSEEAKQLNRRIEVVFLN